MNLSKTVFLNIFNLQIYEDIGALAPPPPGEASAWLSPDAPSLKALHIAHCPALPTESPETWGQAQTIQYCISYHWSLGPVPIRRGRLTT